MTPHVGEREPLWLRPLVAYMRLPFKENEPGSGAKMGGSVLSMGACVIFNGLHPVYPKLDEIPIGWLVLISLGVPIFAFIVLVFCDIVYDLLPRKRPDRPWGWWAFGALLGLLSGIPAASAVAVSTAWVLAITRCCPLAASLLHLPGS